MKITNELNAVTSYNKIMKETLNDQKRERDQRTVMVVVTNKDGRYPKMMDTEKANTELKKMKAFDDGEEEPIEDVLSWFQKEKNGYVWHICSLVMVSNEAATMLVAASVQEVTNHVTSLGDADQVRFFRKESNSRNKRMKEAEINMRAQGRPLSTPKVTKFIKFFICSFFNKLF